MPPNESVLDNTSDRDDYQANDGASGHYYTTL